MSSGQKFLAGLIIGAATGAAVAVFLQTDKGKEILSDIKDAVADAGDSIKTSLKSFGEEINTLLKKGKQFADEQEDEVNQESDFA
jgi:gas vesicle protein